MKFLRKIFARKKSDISTTDEIDSPEEYTKNIFVGEVPRGTEITLCEVCNKPFGKLASLGFREGGYKCEGCGTRSCYRCCGNKAREVGRATMLCPKCGSDRTSVFTIEGMVSMTQIEEDIKEKICDIVGPTNTDLAETSEIVELGADAVPVVIDLFRNPVGDYGTLNQAILADALIQFARQDNHEALVFIKDLAAGKIPTAGWLGDSALQLAKNYMETSNMGEK